LLSFLKTFLRQAVGVEPVVNDAVPRDELVRGEKIRFDSSTHDVRFLHLLFIGPAFLHPCLAIGLIDFLRFVLR